MQWVKKIDIKVAGGYVRKERGFDGSGRENRDNKGGYDQSTLSMALRRKK